MTRATRQSRSDTRRAERTPLIKRVRLPRRAITGPDNTRPQEIRTP